MSWRDMPKWARWTFISGGLGVIVLIGEAAGALNDLYELQPVATKTWVTNRLDERRVALDAQLAEQNGKVQTSLTEIKDSVLEQDKRSLTWRLRDYPLQLLQLNEKVIELREELAKEIVKVPISDFIVRNLRGQISALETQITNIENARDQEQCDLDNLSRATPRPC